MPPGPAGTIFAASILALTMGEVMQVGSAWTLSFAIAPDENRGAYLAAFSMGRSLSRAAGPLLMTGVVMTLGEAGWVALAAVFTAAAVVPVLVARRPAT